jgi:HlyD family secretion protein
MKEKLKNPRILIPAIIIIAVLLFFGIRHFAGGSKSKAGGNAVFVTTVQDLMNPGSGSGMLNRFAGVVETQDSWSVNQNQDVEVKEIFVKEGQEVKKGDKLFSYDTEKYSSDLEQAEIDLERQQNELISIGETIDQLIREKGNASSSEQAAYTIQIQEQELAQKQKDLDIRSKQAEIDKLKDNIAHATVSSAIDGVVQSIRENKDQSYYDGGDQAFITVVKTGDYRIKGTVNEQNFNQIWEGAPVLVHSRVDAAQTWKGTVSRIDTENPDNNSNQGYYGGDSGNSGSKYPFYVELESSSGLIMGQHVYMEVNYGQEELGEREGIWLEQYYVDETDPDAPFVWADDGSGRLKKCWVSLGERDDELFLVQITQGLELTDAVAVPDSEYQEGMPTVQTH